MASTEDNKALVARFYDEVVNGRRLDLVPEVLDSGYVEHNNPAGSGIEGFIDFFKGLGVAFPDLRLTVEDMVAEGNRVVARVTVRGTHRGEFAGVAATNREVTFTGIDIFEIEDGRIIGRWNLRDLLGLLGQLEGD